MLHELAHVKRLDVLFQMVATVACSFYWFNPLIWYALGRLRVERNWPATIASWRRVKGPATTRTNSSKSRDLVERGDWPRAWRWPARPSSKGGSSALGSGQVARSDHRAPLARSRSCRGSARNRGRGAGTRRPRCRRRGIGQAVGKGDRRKVAPAAERAANVEPTVGQAKSIGGRVSDPQGNPVRGAQIWARRLLSADWQWRPVATSDARGLFRFDINPATLAKTLKSNEALSLQIHRKVPIALAASAAGFGFGLIERAGLTSKREKLVDVSIRLVKDVPVTGRILTVDGRPASGTSVSVGGVRQPDEATLDEYIRLARQGKQGRHDP